jgi:ubiquinone/menaquinone biosynthesis C-methylase UbiE
MLKRAREKIFGGRVTFRQGSGEALPLKDRSADMVFMSMVFHHLREPEGVARECHRVLRPGGSVCLRNGTAEEIASFQYLRHFPGAIEIAETRLVSGEGIKAVFAAAGFETAAHRIVVHQQAPSWEALVEKLNHRADSFLAGLSDADFQRGLSALRGHAARADPGESVTANINLFVFRR